MNIRRTLSLTLLGTAISLTACVSDVLANKQFVLLNQKTMHEITRDIGDSWPSLFSTNANNAKDYAGDKIDEAKETMNNLFVGSWSYSAGKDGPTGFEYAGRRESGEVVRSKNFDINYDCIRCSPKDFFEKDYRPAKAIFTEYHFQKYYLPAMAKYRELRDQFKDKDQLRKPMRLGQWNPSSVQKEKDFAAIYKAAEKSKPRMSWRHLNSEMMDSMKTCIADNERQTGLITMLNADRTWDSKEQWLIAHAVEPCFVREVGKSDGKLIEAFAIYFVDLDPELNPSLQNAKDANFHLFYFPKLNKYSFSMDYLEKVEKTRKSKIQTETYTPRSKLSYSSSIN